jgi:hypothetical protein
LAEDYLSHLGDFLNVKSWWETFVPPTFRIEMIKPSHYGSLDNDTR